MAFHPFWNLMLFSLVICAVRLTVGHDGSIDCGRRKLRSVYLILNGTDAIAGHWPWHAAIFHLKDNRMKYVCGGSILDRNTILTAAHCVHSVYGVIPRRYVSIQLGRVQLKEENEYIESHDVEDIIVHPQFSTYSIAYDIALIKLARNITMSKYIQPVCLWNLDYEIHSVIGKNGTIVGFGLTENDTGSDHLKQALVKVMDPLDCIETDRVLGALLTTEMFCGMGLSGTNPCNGDSGGGVFFEISGKWFMRGLVSFTPARANRTDLCDGKKSTVYTDVAKYLKWITQYVDARVLHDETEVIVDYEEKHRLFDYTTCGQFSNTSNLPWYGTLEKESFFDQAYSTCAVTLISEWYAVAPARCFSNDDKRLQVVLKSKTVPIQRVIIHPKYNSSTYANDIALIELYSPVNTTNPDSRPICLHTLTDQRFEGYQNLTMTKLTVSSSSTVPVVYLNSTGCTVRYAHDGVKLQTNQFCAQKTDEYSVHCWDIPAGAPLHQTQTLGGTERQFLRGFQLFAQSCRSTASTVFVSINEYMDWILFNMRYNDPVEAESDHSAIESDWNNLKWEPNEGWLRSFTENICGSIWQDESSRYPSIPWLGWLHANPTVTIADMEHDAIAMLIHKRFALTAAVIATNRAQWRFLSFGPLVEYFTCPTGDCGYIIQAFDVRGITIHPGYRSSPRRNDIALVELWQEVADTWALTIQPICLPWTESLRRSKPLSLTMSTIDLFFIFNRQLVQVNSTSCQERFLLNGYQIKQDDIAICTFRADDERPVAIIPGAPLQAKFNFDDDQRYFLRGLNYDHFESGEYTGQMRIPNFNLPYLFTDINTFLDWIAHEVRRSYVADYKTLTNASSTVEHFKSDQVKQLPIRNTRKIRLFDFKTCGAYYRESMSTELIPAFVPWTGTDYRTDDYNELYECAATLISDRYVELETGSSRDRHRIQKIILHPGYVPASLNNNVALIQLTEPAKFSKPICMPVIAEVRTSGYERSNLLTFVMNYEHAKMAIEPIGDRYVDPIYCQKYWNKLNYQTAPFRVNSTICIYSHPVDRLARESYPAAEGSPIFSKHALQGVERYFLRGFSLRTGSVVSFAPTFYLEIDDYLDWIMDNMNDTLHLNDLTFDLTKTLLFN
uniref:Peptidase S1 domain-containing protein n=1 Tax=Anopheles dirus TaxID=7168 RepID=A0A182MXV7_9DIPT